MKKAALLLVLALAPSVRADESSNPGVALDIHAWKLKIGGEVTVSLAASLLVGTAVRAAVSDEGPPACNAPCLDHDTVRDMGILAGAATVAFAIGIPLLAVAHRDHRRALVLRAGTVAATF